VLRDQVRKNNSWLQHKEKDHVDQDHPGFRIGDRRHLRRTGICWTFFCAVHPHAGLLVFLLGDQHVLGVTSWTATLSGSKDLTGSRRMRSELGHCVMAGRELAIISAREVNQFAMFDGSPALFWARRRARTPGRLTAMIHCRSDLQYPMTIVTAQRAIKWK
jgi:hypothetical protein